MREKRILSYEFLRVVDPVRERVRVGDGIGLARHEVEEGDVCFVLFVVVDFVVKHAYLFVVLGSFPLLVDCGGLGQGYHPETGEENEVGDIVEREENYCDVGVCDAVV